MKQAIPQPIQFTVTITLDSPTTQALADRIAWAIKEALRADVPESRSQGQRAGSTAPSSPEPLLLSNREAAKVLHVCEKTLWNLRKTGQIPQPV